MQEIFVGKSNAFSVTVLRLLKRFLWTLAEISPANIDIGGGVLYNENNEKKGLYSEETRK